MEPFLAFFIIVIIGLFSSTLLRRFHFPWVVALIVSGIIIGPDVLNMFQADATTEFLGSLGLTFLMFMAGLETKAGKFEKSNKDLFLLSFINGTVPFLVGVSIGHFFGLEPLTIFMIGVVFVSSSIAVVVPMLENNGLIEKKIGNSVLITLLLQDVASLILLSVLLQNVNPVSRLPLYVFYPLLILVIILTRFLIPKVKSLLSSFTSGGGLFQDELRSVFFILIGTVLLFQLLGLHSIIGGFFAGLVLSDSITDKVLIGKIRAISYGVFIPAFFILVGIHTDIKVLLNLNSTWYLVLAIVLGSLLSKYFSGFLGAKLVGFSKRQASFFGVSSIPQLSTTLAASFTANKYGIISNELNTAFVVLSIVTTLIGPVLMSRFDTEKLVRE